MLKKGRVNSYSTNSRENEIFYVSNYMHSGQTMNIFPILVKLNFKRGEVTSPDIRTAMRSEVWVFVRGFLDSTLLWNSGERKCRAPSGNVSPSSSDRASICLEADSSAGVWRNLLHCPCRKRAQSFGLHNRHKSRFVRPSREIRSNDKWM